MTDIDAIRARHLLAEGDGWTFRADDAGRAHRDRATLLQALAEREYLIKMFLAAAYPVATEVDPRGYTWSEAYLDQARAEAFRNKPSPAIGDKT